MADLTYVAVAVGFVYVAVIIDAWPRRIVGYGLSRRTAESRFGAVGKDGGVRGACPRNTANRQQATPRSFSNPGLSPMIQAPR